jgi:hypothetical protein
MRGLETAGPACSAGARPLSSIERRCQRLLMAAHSSNAGSSHALRASASSGRRPWGLSYSRAANGQHQPASSRVIATFAITGFFRSSNVTQRILPGLR